MKTAVLKLDGQICAKALCLDSYKETIDKAYKYAGKKGMVILYINSPGGSPSESQSLYVYIKSKRGTVKEVVTYINNVCASGGYWIAQAGDKIISNPYAIVGSVGVVMQPFNFKELLDKIGVKVTTISSGKNKCKLNPFDEINDEDIKHFEEIASELHDKFIEHVLSNRNIDRDNLDGSWFIAEKAKELGFVDEIKSSIYEISAKSKIFKVKKSLIKSLL